MRRYIDADALKKRMFNYYECVNEDTCKGNYRGDTLMDYEVADMIEDCIDNAPTADVVEVRHGTWYRGAEMGAVYAKCSACGRKMGYSCYGYAYCALCGARMDGERREQCEIG